jgi:subfamily B ATP-binding cassette protein MsbA
MNKTDKPDSDAGLYLRLLHYVAPYWRVFAVSVVAMVVFAATEPGVSALQKPLFDHALIGKDSAMLMLIPVLFVALFAVRGLASYVSGVALHWVANKVVLDLRNTMFARLLAFPSHYYDRHTTGSLISRFTYDVTQIREAATNALTVLVKDSLGVLGLLGLMFYLDWKMTLIAMAGGPLIVLVVSLARRRLRRMSRESQSTMGEINQVLREVIDGQKMVKLYDGAEREVARFHEVANANRRYTMKFAMAAVMTGPAVQLVVAVIMALIIYYAVIQVQGGYLTVGDFAAFFSSMLLLLGPLKRLVRINEHVQRGLAACETIFGLLDEPVETDTGLTDVDRLRGEIVISNLGFRYHDKQPQVLDNISLHIQPGETVALVGASGSGKTTLANLLPRFYEQGTGSITLDGRDIRDISLASLRANIALVSQDIFLFNDTVRANIAYGGKSQASAAEVDAAATAAHAMDFIRALPQGMDTVLGQGGTQLSGGQRQRIALARALLKQAPILILDEATSALDPESERQIQQALEELRHRHTCIIIAHRLSTIESADRIIVLDNGRVVETGSHDELLHRDGVYSRFHAGGEAKLRA